MNKPLLCSLFGLFKCWFFLSKMQVDHSLWLEMKVVRMCREFKTCEGGNLFPLILEIAGEKNFINLSQRTKGGCASPTYIRRNNWLLNSLWTTRTERMRNCSLVLLLPFSIRDKYPLHVSICPEISFQRDFIFFSSERSAVEMEWGRLSVIMKWFSSSEAKGGGGGGGGSEPIRLLKVERLDSVAVNR